MDTLPIVDTHQHLWDLSRFRLPWLHGQGEPLGKSHLPSDYARAAAGLGIVRTVYMEVDVAPEQRVEEAKYVFGLCADPKDPMAAAVVGGDPASPGFVRYLDAVASPYLKGVRQVLHGDQPAGYCLTDAFQAGLKELGRRHLLFDLCLRPGELSDAAEVARRLPESRFILDHCGNGPVQGGAADTDRWKRGLEKVAARPNVVCKVSGIIAGAKKGGAPFAEQLAPFIDFTLDAFGPERTIFASDWPVCTLSAPLSEWVATLKTILVRRPAEQQKKLFHDNAVRVYGL